MMLAQQLYEGVEIEGEDRSVLLPICVPIRYVFPKGDYTGT